MRAIILQMLFGIRTFVGAGLGLSGGFVAILYFIGGIHLLMTSGHTENPYILMEYAKVFGIGMVGVVIGYFITPASVTEHLRLK